MADSHDQMADLPRRVERAAAGELFSTLTDQDALAELRREQRMRERLYPLWRAQGKIEPEDADRQMRCLTLAISIVERFMQVSR